jgi:uncharacterized membrane protein YtjA (UPF0391 family)
MLLSALVFLLMGVFGGVLGFTGIALALAGTAKAQFYLLAALVLGSLMIQSEGQ